MNESMATFVEILRSRSRSQPDQHAYTFLLDGEAGEAHLTYRDLDRQARAIGALQQRFGRPGERGLLLYPPGLDYIAAFLGCLYAGVIAVPAYPPNPARLERTLPRLRAIVRDAQPTFALTTSPILGLVSALAAQDPEFQALRWLATDTLAPELADEWCDPAASDTTLAFLQYTSGSTATPKGVMVSHGNLLHNQRLIKQAFGHTEQTVVAGWLPLYHDMGLIGNVLQPLYLGTPCVLMSPMAFLQRPARWLEAISRYRATTSGGPNFAYDLCVRKIAPEQRAEFDLSSWTVAFNGAEPIRHDTLERFAAAFAPCGFRRSAFYPCYGLAESTLFVSGVEQAAEPIVRVVDEAALEQHRVQPRAGTPGRTLVGSGRTWQDQAATIVDPVAGTRCPPDQVGEVWVSGPSVAQGYWQQPDETARTFGARLADGAGGPFLRTGDLGFIQDGELFITGRLKDLIIIRGRNHYPQDIELTVERSHRALRPGGGAAFTVERDGEERLVIVQEIEREQRNVDVEAAAGAIRQAVAEQHELHTYAVVLIKPGSLPKTSSGKIQRHTCRADYLAGRLAPLGSSVLEEATVEADAAQLTREALLAQAAPARQELLETYLRDQIARVLGVAPAQVDARQSTSSLGIDSLMAIELQHRVETSLGTSLPLASLLQGATIGELAAEIQANLAVPAGATAPALVAAPATDSYPLSHGQQALWFLHQLAPTSPAYNIASAVRIRSALDIAALRRAFQALIDRHPALRTTFSALHGAPVQHVHAQAEVAFQAEDAASWSAEALDARLVEAAQRPFDLERGPLLRVHLFSRAPGEHVLLLALHHLVTDFWSLAVLVDELGALYAATETGAQAEITPLPAYADYVRWQAELLASPAGERLWAYWRDRLAGELPALNLPTDRPRPPVQTYNGDAQALRLSADLTRRLRDLGRAHDATLYVTLLAAFQALLFRYTGQEDLLIGSLTAGRGPAALARVAGYFVNPVVVRADLAGNPPFTALLRQARATVLEAFEHQDYPFAFLVERLDTKRDSSRSPIFQAMFVWQQTPSFSGADLAPLALGEAGVELRLAGLRLESIALAQRAAQFDLTLAMAPAGDELRASLQYNTDLFDHATIARMLEHFQTMLEAIAVDPALPVSRLPLLTTGERGRLLGEWNATEAAYARDMCIHELFEAQAARTPDATALVFNDVEVSYRDLNRRANQLAHHLRKLGVGREALVGICVERSVEMLVGLLGILKAGGAYLPLDPSYPAERLRLMLEDAQVAVLLTAQRGRGGEGETAQAATLPLSPSPLLPLSPSVVDLVADKDTIAQQPATNPDSGATTDNLAYVIYTSGSTGRPKGVMVRHGSVVNFFSGMDQRVGCDGADTLLAVTSISFDISVLELFWTLARGARVVLLPEAALVGGTAEAQRAADRQIEFSLFYFASDDSTATGDKYRLLLEGAKFADQHGFAAVWTPERHFHAFGGLYPNPAVMSAALAVATERVQIRAGSVVLPLHNPIRVAEEWALVDNLSRGRTGIAFASGWHSDDFVFFPDHYADRKEVMAQGIETVRRLWRGEPVAAHGGAGNEVTITIFPRPIQPELPIWLTAAGSADTFVKAGEIGANVLTHLLGQTLDEVAQKIGLYRAALAAHGHDPRAGRVTLMLHTLIGNDRDAVRELVRAPFTAYLRTSIGLIGNLIKSLDLPLDLASMSEQDMDALLAFAFDRYFETSALFGTPATCAAQIERLKAIGVDEVACLIDFGVDVDTVLASLQQLNVLREQSSRPRAFPTDIFGIGDENLSGAGRDTTRLQERSRPHLTGLGETEQVAWNSTRVVGDYSLATQARRYQATLMQCTPSTMRMLALNQQAMEALASLRTLLLGGEALPPALAREVGDALACRLVNMYGPTETTIWSATHEIHAVGSTVAIGRPIANTQLYILDRQMQPAPIGIAGELYIGGDGLARGYLGRPDLTAERFVPNPFIERRGEGESGRGGESEVFPSPPLLFSPSPSLPFGGRLYRTGDLCRYRPDGTIEFLGRTDQQIKLRGYRIELGEIEAALGEHPDVHESAVMVREDSPGDRRLVAYVVPGDWRLEIGDSAPDNLQSPISNLPQELRAFLKQRLPDYMLPATFVLLDALPLTTNGKLDRKALPVPEGLRPDGGIEFVAPDSALERTIAAVWQQALQVADVGVHDNFFDLGGHSLLMAQVHSQLQAALERELPLVKLLEHPTISALAAYLSADQAETASFHKSQERARKQRASALRQRQRAKMEYDLQ